ncbi:MAG: vanadium-dependent haloperoxidase [Candidatus Contendobacter sp.]|nr:vanadium-dependent haloperoxidase [Candidatus Contendobacter sp.]MDS4057502.1 vanadium-dependent haloperoxidase [Candidatus Contendobacter sp.]
MTFPTPNNDESLTTPEQPFIGNFHKTLPHNEYGEVDKAAYRKFERACLEIEAGSVINFEEVPSGPVASPFPAQSNPLTQVQSAFESCANPALTKSAAKFTSPLAGASTETHGPDPKSLEMLPAPGCLSISAAAEMVELYWMALLRDAPLVAFQQYQAAPNADPNSGCLGAKFSEHDGPGPNKLGYKVVDRINAARKAVNMMFDCAISHDTDPGRLRAPLDLQAGSGGADIRIQTLFRTGLFGEDIGPLVSQFFIRPIGYGVQSIDQKEVPYIAKRDFLTTHGEWLLAQNTGKDKYGRDYGSCNNYADQRNCSANMYYPTENGNADGPVIKRYVSTMRDLARFVNRDALHQAYFNAALFLDGIGAPLDAGNPYRGNRYSREGGFATLGGPDLLTLVSEVASRALKVIWRQKWLVHRRCRPEVYGGLLQMQLKRYMGNPREYGLPQTVQECSQFDNALSDTLAAVASHNAAQNGGTETLFLPMAFSAGSPSHPAYGAGHATVAGACVTVLKAWFDEDAKLADIFAEANKKRFPKDPPISMLKLLQPGYRKKGGTLEDFCEPQEYTGEDADKITVGGELNKIASNVAMGRSMGGVHWRSDNTRSLRLGEEIAIEILRKRTMEYAERPVSFTFRSFDRNVVHITQGQVRIS